MVRTLLVLSLAVAASAAAAAPTRHRPAAATPHWRASKTLADPADRALAASWMKDEWYCRESKGEESACADFETARISLPRHRSVLLLRTYSGGTCGTYEFGLFGVAGQDGRRVALKDGTSLLSMCAEDLSYRLNGTAFPTLYTVATVDRFGPRAPVAETTTWSGSARGYVRGRRVRSYNDGPN